jgi:transposase
MAVVNRDSRPVAVKLTSATPFESTLVEDTLKERFSTKHKVQRLTGDKAYDSDPLDKKLKKKGVELNAPHERNRKKKRTQDGRKLRGYRNRWVVERFFAWLQNFRRCLVRYERKIENFLSFIHLAIIIMLLWYF